MQIFAQIFKKIPSEESKKSVVGLKSGDYQQSAAGTCLYRGRAGSGRFTFSQANQDPKQMTEY